LCEFAKAVLEGGDLPRREAFPPGSGSQSDPVTDPSNIVPVFKLPLDPASLGTFRIGAPQGTSGGRPCVSRRRLVIGKSWDSEIAVGTLTRPGAATAVHDYSNRSPWGRLKAIHLMWIGYAEPARTV